MNAQVNTIQIQQPDEQALSAQANQFLVTAKGITITDQESLQVAISYLNENKAEQKRLDEERREMVDPLNKVVKTINDKFRPIAEALKKAETIIKGSIGSYQLEQDRKRQKEIAEAEERARKERERLEARAEKAAEKGHVEKAESLAMQAATTVATVSAAPETKIQGASIRKVWKADVTNPVAVCKLIAEGVLPPTIIDFKAVELNKVASTWQNNRQFDGLRIYQDSVVASR